MKLFAATLALASLSFGIGLDTIQPNRWYPISVGWENNAPFQTRGWGSMTYNHNLEAVFFDGLGPTSHGNYCIYANTLFSLDVVSQIGTVEKQSNWYCNAGQATTALPANASDPTPVDRHYYHQFAFSPLDSSVYTLHGANQSAPGGHPHDFWKYSFRTGAWTRIGQAPGPHESWNGAVELNLIEATGELWFFLNARDIYVFTVATQTWRTHTVGTDRYAVYPIGGHGDYDPVRRRFFFYGDNCCTTTSNLFAFFSRDSLTWSTRTGPVALRYAAIEYNSRWDVYMLGKGVGSDAIRIYHPQTNQWETWPVQGTLANVGQHVELAYIPGLDVVVNQKQGNFYVMRYRPNIVGVRRTVQVSKSYQAQGVVP